MTSCFNLSLGFLLLSGFAVPPYKVLNQDAQLEEVGIDLGLKTFAVLSDGMVIENQSEFKKLEEKLGKTQRAKKKNQAKKIQAKTRNKRRVFFHKKTKMTQNGAHRAG